MNASFMIIVVLVLIMSIASTNRMRGAANVPLGFWFALLTSAAASIATGWLALNPGEPVATTSVAAAKDHSNIEVPANHDLLITASLSPEKAKDPSNAKTSYTLKLQGLEARSVDQGDASRRDWKQSLSGTISRENADSGPDVAVFEGQAVSDSTKQRNATGMESLQDRHRLVGSGNVDVLVSNYQGTAAEKLRIDVIPSLPAPVILWSFGLLMTVFGIYLEGVKKCEQVSGEIGALALFPIFLCDSITPLDSWMQTGLSFVPGFFLGALASGVAWLVRKYNASSQA